MEKRKKNRLQSSWLTQQHKSRDSSRTNSAKSCSTNRNFVFEQTDVLQKRSGQQEKVITKAGVHVISNAPSGIASIELDPIFISMDETKWMFNDLESQIPWQEKNIKVQGHYHRQPRLTAWFGDFSYEYSGLTLKPFQWSPLLNMLRERILKMTGLTFNSMLANLYRNEKDSVDWHSDDESSLGTDPTICSLSFGETRNFEMRKKPEDGDDYSDVETIKIPLPSGSLLIMSGATQSDWQHRIPKEYHSRGPRINLTFRNIILSHDT
ncbi:alpha-ketoglutarate-dependent dioxygenase alkB homolog 3-like isoform X3 [Dendronephthya gigantea]|uniref:alpha-ketoglutarate-dependent dioxygenase alkB homolog 3-like isoform X3 n=1 Tax=Dendronephthya gigantea TaxID=151771 RepID=UPI00106CFC9D|nr:alpha-ketoglutarate-dependent dioxygenase alkB homolog 3-like isoform X3 [Dendronephthya gigantea]